MSEEEEIIRNLKRYINLSESWKQEEYHCRTISHYIEILLDLYQQEKEKNKELEDKCKEVVCVPEETCSIAVPKNMINKDKLKFILSKLNISDIEPWSTYKVDGQILFDLQELL